MAPTRVKTGASKGANKRPNKKTSSSSPKTKQTASHVKKTTKQKAQTKPSRLKKWKARTYTEAELSVPQLNMITPAGVQRAKGRKKGKVFVDDQESMMTILAMVNADKDGQIESKMIKEVTGPQHYLYRKPLTLSTQRQMEEIRDARREEMEIRAEQKRSKFEKTKDSVRKEKKEPSKQPMAMTESFNKRSKATRKRVSFA
ncbi:MAG: 60S ribosomal subunit assembly/export protein [Chrysothrix sp. TS-e1954]|nr:MAG: 60S ribosomal subunit assembly/export protein [Chrysothrix sp. TS-e1954]